MISYPYIQQVDYSSILKATIIGAALSSANFLYIGTDGSGSSMVVNIWFDGPLSSEDQTTLNTIMSSYVNTTPLTPAYMSAQIISAISTDANLITLLRGKVVVLIPTLTPTQLQQAMTLLGLS